MKDLVIMIIIVLFNLLCMAVFKMFGLEWSLPSCLVGIATIGIIDILRR